MSPVQPLYQLSRTIFQTDTRLAQYIAEICQPSEVRILKEEVCTCIFSSDSLYIYSETDSILNSESSSDDYDSDTTSLCSDLDLGHGSTPVSPMHRNVSVTHIDQCGSSSSDPAGYANQSTSTLLDPDILSVVKLMSSSHRVLTDVEKNYLLKNTFVPPSNYKFPTRMINRVKRHFQFNWLSKYNGLVYSETENGGFCKFCVLFAKCGPTRKKLGVLVNMPLTNFKRGVEKLDEHFGEKRFHRVAVETAMLFTKVQENQSLSIESQLCSQREITVKENRAKLKCIVETIVLCGRQGLALRGHRDDQEFQETDPLQNHGNFLALLRFRVQSGDQILENHLKSGKANALYTSKLYRMS